MAQTTHERQQLDSGTLSDDELLEQLGYKPELKRTLGKFSSFAVQFGRLLPSAASCSRLLSR